MALDDEILSERRRQWSRFTRLMTVVVIAAAIHYAAIMTLLQA